MRHRNNIFESDGYRIKSTKTQFSVKPATIISFAILVLIISYLLINFDSITVMIALWIADVFTLGFPILLALLFVVFFFTKSK